MITFLRWTVGITSALALALFVLILIVGNGIASAYRSGASSEDFLKAVAPFGVAVLLSGMLASAFLPRARLLLHAVAVLAGAAVAACATILPERPGEALFYIAFFAIWLTYYAVALRLPYPL